MSRPAVFLLLCVSCSLASVPVASAEIGRKEYSAAVKKLKGAVSAADTGEFLDAVADVLRRDDASALRTALDSYAALMKGPGTELSARQFFFFHGRVARSLAKLRMPRTLAEYRKLLLKHRAWHARLALLDGASFNERVDLLETALTALQDDDPRVVRRALDYLARSKSRPVAEAIVDRWLAADKKAQKEKTESDWQRTAFACQAALGRMLRLELPAAADYRNYIRARPDDDKLFNPPAERKHSKTALTLFGAAVTGKNIAFVLDTSGSMRTTDPPPAGSATRPRGSKTVVRRPGGKGEISKPPIEQERMYRAKRELAKVVRQLPEDVRFNIVTYSSDVLPWQQALVRADSTSKKRAEEFIKGLKPEGITVTDMALEEAFADMGIDTIYLITDGAPTHVGTRQPGAMPPDSRDLIREIIRRIRVVNFLRGVRIFTLGFRGAEEDFLRDLSRDHNGRYVPID